MENTKIVSDRRFEQILKEEARDFSIDWSLVDINWILYEELLLSHLTPPLGKKKVKMVVLGFNGAISVPDVDSWVRSHRFAYCIYYNIADTETEDIEALSLGGEATIKEMAIELKKIFSNFKG